MVLRTLVSFQDPFPPMPLPHWALLNHGNPHIRESRTLAPVRPRMQAAGLQYLKLQIAVASPDPQTRDFFPVRRFPGKLDHPRKHRPLIRARCPDRTAAGETGCVVLGSPWVSEGLLERSFDRCWYLSPLFVTRRRLNPVQTKLPG